MAQDEKKNVRVALIQMTCSENKSENIEKAVQRITEAKSNGADLVCLQELFHGQYPCQAEDHDKFEEAEPIPGPISTTLSELAKNQEIVIVDSQFERRAHGLYHNTAVIFDKDGSTAGTYRKMHIPDDPLFYEKFYFTPGDLGFDSFDTQAGKVASLVCWDQWFPEAARLMALSGAELLFYPTAIGWLPEEKEQYGESQYHAWSTMIKSHAIANGMFVFAVNRVGFEGPLQFWGGSLIVDPYGNVLAKGSHEEEEILYSDCDLSLINVARTHWPFFRDRRIDAYEGLLKRFGN